MKVASVADIKARLSAYLKATAERPVVVTRNGKAVAVLVAVGDDDDLERLRMAHSPRFQAIMAAALKRIQAGKRIPHDEFWKKVEKDRRIEKASGKREKNGRTKR